MYQSPIFVLSSLLASAVSSQIPAEATTTSHLNWHSCPDVNQLVTTAVGVAGAPFDCAALSVPLDYTDSDSKSLELSLFKLNATQQPVLGSVLVNFGGPGGPGGENLPTSGPLIAKYIGPQWDIITWDPRGTGRTIPFDCNSSSTFGVPSASLSKRDVAFAQVNVTEAFIESWDALGQIADQCYKTMNDTGRFISSASTAKDVMAIVDALGEDGLLRYWGWSYGTALGSYIAALFPDRIDRMVLDGNLNPLDYQSGTVHDSAKDLDKTFRAFLQECLNNRDDCNLARMTKSQSVDDIITALNVVQKPLTENVTGISSSGFSYLTIPTIIFPALYYPVTWPDLADTLATILNGTYKASPPPRKDVYDLGSPWSVFGIRGADAIWQTDNLTDYLPEVEYQANLTNLYSTYAYWVSARWKITPTDRYTGNFNVTTRHPILYVNSEYDPITPIIGAYNASRGFKGSVVLAHTGYGHGVIVDDSICVQRYTNDYFVTGDLPPVGTICHPDKTPWELATAAAAAAASGNSSSGSNASSTTSSQTPAPTLPMSSAFKDQIQMLMLAIPLTALLVL